MALTGASSVDVSSQFDKSTAPPILVVDDDETIRTLLRLALEADGYLVLEAADGAAALDIVRRTAPGAILVDSRMAGMDGAAFVRAYRALPAGQAPVIMLSAGELPDDALAGVAVDAAMRKPFDVDDLLALVGRLAIPSSN